MRILSTEEGEGLGRFCRSASLELLLTTDARDPRSLGEGLKCHRGLARTQRGDLGKLAAREPTHNPPGWSRGQVHPSDSHREARLKRDGISAWKHSDCAQILMLPVHLLSEMSSLRFKLRSSSGILRFSAIKSWVAKVSCSTNLGYWLIGVTRI